MASNQMNSFEPPSDLVQEPECDTLLLYLPGFTKEQLRVQLARSRVLKISGTRPIGDNKWSSFSKDFPISENCDTNKITAKFEDGILYVRQPKVIVTAEEKLEDPKISPSETTQSQTPPANKPPTQKIDGQDQATTSQKTTTQSQTPPDNKPLTEKIDGQDQATTNQKTTPSDDHNKKTSHKESELMKHDDRRAAKGSTVDEQREKSSKNIEDKMANKGFGHSNVLTGVNDYKLNAESPAAKLKMVRQKMTMVLAVLFAFALGVYVSNNLAWFSRKVEE